MTNLPEPTRAWLYRVGTALVPLLVGYGLLAEQQAALWLGLLGAVLGTGLPALASANTSTRRPPTDGG